MTNRAICPPQGSAVVIVPLPRLLRLPRLMLILPPGYISPSPIPRTRQECESQIAPQVSAKRINKGSRERVPFSVPTSQARWTLWTSLPFNLCRLPSPCSDPSNIQAQSAQPTRPTDFRASRGGRFWLQPPRGRRRSTVWAVSISDRSSYATEVLRVFRRYQLRCGVDQRCSDRRIINWWASILGTLSTS